MLASPRKRSLSLLSAVLLALSPLVPCRGGAPQEKSAKIAAADQLMEQNALISERYYFTFRNLPFVGYPDVYSPVIFPGAQKQCALPVGAGDHFLEIGSGTGVFAVMAAHDGADKVVAIDINPAAVANTRENALLHGVDSKVTVLQGDMFGPLAADERFDLIFFNIPFCHRACPVSELTMLGRSLFDPEHDLLHRFLKEGRRHLKEGGRLILGYSTTHGDVERMRRWAEEYGWQVTLLHKQGDERSDFITVELYQFR